MTLLRIVHEADVFTKVANLSDFLADWKAEEVGRTLVVSEAEAVPETELKTSLLGRVGGENVPDWADGKGGRYKKTTEIHRARDVYYVPGFGAAITADGLVLHQTVEEALYVTPTLAKLPFVELTEDGIAKFRPPASLPNYSEAFIFITWGGLFNYGHFLIDCLTAVVLVDEMKLRNRFEALAPAGLDNWQKDLLRLTCGEELRFSKGQVVRIQDVIYGSTMAHFLHGPNELVAKLRDRLLRNSTSNTPARLIAISRKGSTKRLMINEDEFELRLRQRGFTIVQPEKMTIAEQREIFSNAKMVIGATGAAFANVLFSRPHTAIIEIQPISFTGTWVRSLCEELNLFWHGFFVNSAEMNYVSIENKKRVGEFSFAVPLDEFFSFLDSKFGNLWNGSAG